jgi:hypothetical protein
MFARIGTWQGSPQDLENWVVRAGEVVKPNVQHQPGRGGGLLARGSRGREGPDDHVLGERGGDARQRRVPRTKPVADLRGHGGRSDDDRKV